MTEKAKFKYSAHEGMLELEGSEEFITKHFESLTDIVRVISRHITIEQKTEIISTDISGDQITMETPQLSTVTQKENLSSYPKTFSEINGKLKIVSEIPGNSLKSKMVNTAILYCYGSKLLGDDQVSSKEIRLICEEHGCLDSANFATALKDKTIFLSDGVKGGNKDVKLTFQGEKKAKELLASA